MKATIYYDQNGAIQSVMLISSDAATTPQHTQFENIEIDMDESDSKTLFEIHSQYQVDVTRKKLIRRPGRKHTPAKD